MIVFATRHDKGNIIALFDTLFTRLLFPGLKRDAQDRIKQHLQWMRGHPNEMSVTCRLETFPETETMNIVIASSFKKAVKL